MTERDQELHNELDCLLDQAEAAVGAFREAIESVCADLSTDADISRAWALGELEVLLANAADALAEVLPGA
jgi:hypothetical protein